MNPFADHIIDHIESYTLERVYPRPIGWNAKGGPHGQRAQVAACRLHTNQGASGWGFCAVSEAEKPRFIGRPMSDFFHPATGCTVEALSLDRALHDLAGTILGQPVWRMLGGKNGQIPVYSGAIYFDDLNPSGKDPGTGALLAACAQDAAAGHAHFKLKIGRGFRYMDPAAGQARDVEVTQLVRAHFPKAHLLVDANDSYTPAGICAYLEQVADCRLFWLEEPFEEEAEGLKTLRAAIDQFSPDTLIADGEARNGRLQDPLGPFGKWQADHLDELFELGTAGLIDVLLMDIGAMGFTAWRQVMPKLLTRGIQGSPHAWSEPCKTYYAAQLGCGLGGVPIVEGVPGQVEGVDDSAYVLKDGILSLPETPGFGMVLER